MNKRTSRVVSIREIENEVNVILDKHKNSYQNWHDSNFKSQNIKNRNALKSGSDYQLDEENHYV